MTKKKLPLVQQTAPERIWLAVADEAYYADQPFPDGEEVCWSSDAPLEVCVPYVRADLAEDAAMRDEVVNLKTKLAEQAAEIEVMERNLAEAMNSLHDADRARERWANRCSRMRRKAIAAERAREEAVELLRELFKRVNRLPFNLASRIAAFLAANGGSNA